MINSAVDDKLARQTFNAIDSEVGDDDGQSSGGQGLQGTPRGVTLVTI